MPAKTRFVQWFVASATKGDLKVRASPLSMCVSVHLYTSGLGSAPWGEGRSVATRGLEME
jgi:hypothetical protein